MLIASFLSLLRDIISSTGRKGPTEANLSQLLNATTPTTAKLASCAAEPKDAILRCLNLAASARTYCSRLVMAQETKYSSERSRSSIVEWRLDFTQPDDFHVAQAVRENGDYDEWITIGNNHYIRAAIWLRNDEERNDTLNHFLLVEKYLVLLRSFDPVSARFFRYLMRPYLAVEYKLWDISALGTSGSLLNSAISNVHAGCQAFIWIDLESNRVAKGQLQLKSENPDGSEIVLDVQQAFTNYDKDVHVVRPHIGLEPDRNNPGTYIVTDNHIYPTPFHW